MKRSGDSTHPCRNPTPTVNGHDLTLTTRKPTSEQEYSDLPASNSRPSTPYSRNIPQSLSQGTRSYLEVDKACEDVFSILPRLLKILLESEMWSVALRPGRKPHRVLFKFDSIISRHLLSKHLVTKC